MAGNWNCPTTLSESLPYWTYENLSNGLRLILGHRQTESHDQLIRRSLALSCVWNPDAQSFRSYINIHAHRNLLNPYSRAVLRNWYKWLKRLKYYLYLWNLKIHIQSPLPSLPEPVESSSFFLCLGRTKNPPETCVTFRNEVSIYGVGLLTQRQPLNYSSSSCRPSLTACVIVYSQLPSSTRNLRKRHAVVTRHLLCRIVSVIINVIIMMITYFWTHPKQ
jgi:hypothetical protein